MDSKREKIMTKNVSTLAPTVKLMPAQYVMIFFFVI